MKFHKLTRIHQKELENSENLYIYIYIYIVGPKNLATSAHSISSPRPMPRRKKCLRSNEEGPNCQETLSRTILVSAN